MTKKILSFWKKIRFEFKQKVSSFWKKEFLVFEKKVSSLRKKSFYLKKKVRVFGKKVRVFEKQFRVFEKKKFRVFEKKVSVFLIMVFLTRKKSKRFNICSLIIGLRAESESLERNSWKKFKKLKKKEKLFFPKINFNFLNNRTFFSTSWKIIKKNRSRK